MSEIRGLLHTPDGRATRVTLEWRVGARAFSARGADVVVTAPIADLSITRGGWRGGAVHLAWEDGGTHAVTIDDDESLVALETIAPPAIAEEVRAARLESRGTGRRFRAAVGCFGFLVSLPLLAILFLLFHPDPLLDVVVPRLPTSIDEKVGDLAEQQTLGTSAVLETGPARDAVSAIGRRLLAAAPPHDFAFRFVVIEDEVVNAFAAPGGFVVVHTGLLAAAGSAEEVAGVMAHEIAHVLERHSMRQLTRQVGFWTLVSVVLGSVDGISGVLVEGAAELAELDYSRDQERAADDLGAEIMRTAGLPLDGMIAFFDRLARTEAGGPALLSTHPASDERADRLRALAELPVADPRPLDLDWDAVRASLR